MSEQPATGDTAGKSSAAGKRPAVEDFIKLIVPAPELLEEETTSDPDIEPRETGA